MSRMTIARNLTQYINRSQLSRRQLANSVGLSDKTLWRWMREGVGRLNGKNAEKLESLCQKLGITVGVLSSPVEISQADICAEKVKEIVRIWEEMGIGFKWIHVWHCAAVAVHKLKQQRPEIWQQVCRIMNLASDREAHVELEKWARKRAEQKGADAEAVYQSLFEWAALLKND